MAIGDEFYKVHFGSALNSGGMPELTASPAATAPVAGALGKGHTLTLRLGKGFSDVAPAWPKVADLLKKLPEVKHSLAIMVPVTLGGKDPSDAVLKSSVAPDIKLLDALPAATLVVTLDKGDPSTAATWKDVATVLEKFDVTFEGSMTCVPEGP